MAQQAFPRLDAEAALFSQLSSWNISKMHKTCLQNGGHKTEIAAFLDIDVISDVNMQKKVCSDAALRHTDDVFMQTVDSDVMILYQGVSAEYTWLLFKEYPASNIQTRGTLLQMLLNAAGIKWT